MHQALRNSNRHSEETAKHIGQATETNFLIGNFRKIDNVGSIRKRFSVLLSVCGNPLAKSGYHIRPF